MTVHHSLDPAQQGRYEYRWVRPQERTPTAAWTLPSTNAMLLSTDLDVSRTIENM